MQNHWHLMDSRHRTLFVFRTSEALAMYIRLERWNPKKLAAKRCTLGDEKCQQVNPVYTLTEEEETELVIQRHLRLGGLLNSRYEMEEAGERELSVA